jgi:alpha,alpha-trehalose phosphorylase
VLQFRPQLPPGLEALGFRCRADGAVVEVQISARWVTYSLVDGRAVEIGHNGAPVTLRPGEPVHIDW